MRKNLERSLLSYEELLTVISEIESVMNSRPLCYQYSDEIDDVITPSHLMHGRRMRTDLQFEEITIEETDVTLGKRLTHIENLIEHFQNRWKSEYLTELREHQYCNNLSPSKRVQVGDVVLIQEKKISKSCWRLGLVISLIKGKDGYVRGCKLRVRDRSKKFGNICLQRPINQLCYFEVRSEELNRNETLNENNEIYVDEIVPATLPEIPLDTAEIQRNTRPRRQAAIEGELRRKFTNEI